MLLAVSSPAGAQTSYSPDYREWEVSGFAGQSLLGDFNFPTGITGAPGVSRTVGMEYGSGYVLGARVNQNLGDTWSADLEYSFARQPLQFTNLTPDIKSLSLSHYLHHMTYNISYLPHPPTKRFRPYGDGGIGAALFYITGSSKDFANSLGVPLRDSWAFVFNFGGGFKYLVEDHFSIVFDVKDRVSRVPSYGLPPSAQIVNGQLQPGMSVNGLMNNWQFNFGLTFQWDEY